MAYIFNNSIKYSDSANLDAFGRLRISQLQSIIDVKHTINKLPLIVSEYTAGTATSTLIPSDACVRMTTSANNDIVIRQTKQWATYYSGKGQLFEGSFSNFVIQSNIIKRVGLFNSSTASTYNTLLDGIFLESNGSTNQISFQIWKSGSTIFSAATSAWDSSIINPSSINWSLSQLMFVDYQWLGVGRVRFGMVYSGQTIFFTEYTATNNLSTIYMANPNQPIRYEIRQVGAGSGSLDMICSQVASEGSINDLVRTISIPSTATTTFSTSGVKYPYIGVRINPQYRSILARPNNFIILNTSNDNYLITLEYNPTLSSTPTWTNMSIAPFQYSIQNGTPTITTEGFVMEGFLGEAGTTAVSNFDFRDNIVVMGSSVAGVMDELWICITPLGANATFSGVLNMIYTI